MPVHKTELAHKAIVRKFCPKSLLSQRAFSQEIVTRIQEVANQKSIKDSR